MATIVYLDQNKWIDLSRAYWGVTGGERYSEVLAVLTALTATGDAILPLSVAHIQETWRQTDDGRRRRLAHVMSSLSGHASLANPPALCDNELDVHFASLTGHSPSRPSWPVFGKSLWHASYEPAMLAYADVAVEREWLATRPSNFLDEGLPGRGGRQYGEDYAAAESGLAESMRPIRDERQQLFFLAASAVVEIRSNIMEGLQCAGLPVYTFGDFLEAPVEFIEQLPTRQAALELRTVRHQDPNARWQPNDMFDIAYLACATVHCDVVVTERQWRHLLNRDGIAAARGTTVLSDLTELPDLLAGGAGIARALDLAAPGASERGG